MLHFLSHPSSKEVRVVAYTVLLALHSLCGRLGSCDWPENALSWAFDDRSPLS